MSELAYSNTAGYLSRAFGDPNWLLASFREAVIDQDVTHDTLIGTGLSGALTVPILARGYDKKWAIVRKNDGTHSSYKIEGTIGGRWIFVDDQIETGATLKRVIETVNQIVAAYSIGRQAELVGAYLYAYNNGRYVSRDAISGI